MKFLINLKNELKQKINKIQSDMEYSQARLASLEGNL
jgi:hypothetical protein